MKPFADESIAGADDGIVARHKDLVVALDRHDVAVAFLLNFPHGHADERALIADVFDERVACARIDLAGPRDLGILLHETCGNNTGRDGNSADAQERDNDCHDLPQRRDGVDVTVAHGKDGGQAPPDSGESVAECFRLRLVLRAVHAE